MDGTLANVSSIRHYLKKWDEYKGKFDKNFDKFHEESVNVPPHRWVVWAARLLKLIGFDILIVTARKHKFRNQTAWFLGLNNVPSDVLFMRDDHDNRPDYEVKKDILRKIEKEWDVWIAFDDNPNVIRLWKENNIFTVTVPGWEK